MLETLRVLDFSRVLSGPFCTRMLADLGAEIIKVESVGGDPMRKYPPFKGKHAFYFTQFNAGKKSIAVNLGHEAGVDLIKRLVAISDATVENFRPGLLAEMGLGYPVLKRINPRVICCAISGFGQDGPESQRLAYTDIIQAYGGMDHAAANMLGATGDPPGFPLSFADTYASFNAAIAILAALYHRELTGEGQAIDISMLDCVLAANDTTIQKYIFSDGEIEDVRTSFTMSFSRPLRPGCRTSTSTTRSSGNGPGRRPWRKPVRCLIAMIFPMPG
jgi:crotonobetainyl-CoA:carnitine CoA-transferase CaiB-like acyl-CoA transferase